MSKLFFVFLALVLIVGCGDTGKSRSVKSAKSSVQQKPQQGVSEKAQQEALKAKTLLLLEKQSLRITEVKPSEIQLGLQFLLNQKNVAGFRRYTFNIQKDETLTFDNSQYDLTPDSRLKFEAYRFQSTDKKDHLALHFLFENRETGASEKSSSLVMIIELSKLKKDPVKSAFFYPTPENFDLKKWVELTLNSK